MHGTVDGFRYGLVTPVAAFIMACLGGALGLRCTARSVLSGRSFKAAWLALGATSIGSGIWTMHFIAMMGFSVHEVPLGYDRGITFASLVVAIVMVGIGIFIVGYRGATPMALVTGWHDHRSRHGHHALSGHGRDPDERGVRVQHPRRQRLRGDSGGGRHRRAVGGRVRARLPGEPGGEPRHGCRGQRHALHGDGRAQRPPARRHSGARRAAGSRRPHCSGPC